MLLAVHVHLASVVEKTWAGAFTVCQTIVLVSMFSLPQNAESSSPDSRLAEKTHIHVFAVNPIASRLAEKPRVGSFLPRVLAKQALALVCTPVSVHLCL